MKSSHLHSIPTANTSQTPCQLGGVGSDQIVKAIEDHLGIHSGQTTDDGLFTYTEVECLGACVNAPMVQINDDYYEDLTYDSMTKLLQALQNSAKATMPAPGPQSSRKTCENAKGQTSLTSPMWGTDALRTDGEL